MAAARNALLSNDSEWLERLRASFTSGPYKLTYWQANDTFLKWCKAHDGEAARLLQGLWADGDTISGLHAFLEELPREAAAGPGTRLSLASFLLLGIDATRFPFYKPKAYLDFRELLGLATEERVDKADPESVYRAEDLAARLGLDGQRVRHFLRDFFMLEAALRG